MVRTVPRRGRRKPDAARPRAALFSSGGGPRRPHECRKDEARAARGGEHRAVQQSTAEAEVTGSQSRGEAQRARASQARRGRRGMAPRAPVGWWGATAGSPRALLPRRRSIAHARTALRLAQEGETTVGVTVLASRTPSRAPCGALGRAPSEWRPGGAPGRARAAPEPASASRRCHCRRRRGGARRWRVCCLRVVDATDAGGPLVRACCSSSGGPPTATPLFSARASGFSARRCSLPSVSSSLVDSWRSRRLVRAAACRRRRCGIPPVALAAHRACSPCPAAQRRCGGSATAARTPAWACASAR